MLTREQSEQMHKDIYNLIDTGLFKIVDISESRRFGPSINFHVENDVNEDDVILLITDILLRFNSNIVFTEIVNRGPNEDGILFTTSYYCDDFSVSIYFTHNFPESI